MTEQEIQDAKARLARALKRGYLRAFGTVMPDAKAQEQALQVMEAVSAVYGLGARPDISLGSTE